MCAGNFYLKVYGHIFVVNKNTHIFCCFLFVLPNIKSSPSRLKTGGFGVGSCEELYRFGIDLGSNLDEKRWTWDDMGWL